MICIYTLVSLRYSRRRLSAFSKLRLSQDLEFLEDPLQFSSSSLIRFRLPFSNASEILFSADRFRAPNWCYPVDSISTCIIRIRRNIIMQNQNLDPRNLNANFRRLKRAKSCNQYSYRFDFVRPEQQKLTKMTKSTDSDYIRSVSKNILQKRNTIVETF